MGLYSAFDDGFDGADVSATVSRKGEDGRTRSAKLTGAVPTDMTVESFAEAARMGLKRVMKGKHRGVTLAKSTPELTGEKAVKAVLSLADAEKASTPEKPRKNAGAPA